MDEMALVALGVHHPAAMLASKPKPELLLSSTYRPTSTTTWLLDDLLAVSAFAVTIAAADVR
jgi:hypothetical protein